jgi:NAD(P)H dehydrogenase (quinone)
VYLSLQGASPLSLYPFNRDHFSSEQYLAAAGVPHTILRNSFYLDMFVDKFDASSVVRGPAKQGRGAFVSREDVARVAAAVLLDPPGGTHDVTGPELLSVAEVASRFLALTHTLLRYEDAPPRRSEQPSDENSEWRRELETGWFEAIAAGELAHLSDAVLRFTGCAPLSLENYFSAFPHLLRGLRAKA